MSKKGHNCAVTSLTEKKQKKWVHLYFMVIPHIKFQGPVSNHSGLYASVMDTQMDGLTNRPKPISPRNFFEVGAYKINFIFLPFFKV